MFDLESFPTSAGVYLMKDKHGHVLYIGKAKNLRTRIKQYFVEGRDTRAMIPFLIAKIVSIDTIVVPTEKQALLLENNLIKEHKPQYNILLKDDKTFISLMINHKHKWPMIRIVRCTGKPTEKGLHFGPYPSAYSARQVFELMTRLFPLRQCSDQELKRRSRPCILYSIKRCIAPCVDKCTKQEYDTYVDSAIKFLKGQDKEVIKNLQKKMFDAADNEAFEQAAILRDIIAQVEQITQAKQLIAHPSGKDIDIYGIHSEASTSVLIKLLVREGKLIGSEHFPFTNVLESDEELIISFILQHYNTERFLPKEILIPLPIESISISEILKERTKQNCHLIHPQKGEKKKLVQLANDNAKAAFEKERDQRENIEKTLLDMQEKLKLTRYPRTIQCFDISNISGTDTVGAMVSYCEGKKDKQHYRRFHIKDIKPGDDYKAMHQVLSRQLQRAKEEENLPDLIIVDGGKGQLNIALEVLRELDIASIDVIGLAKDQARHDRGLTKEKVFLPEHSEPIMLSSRSQILFLLQKIRDEAHRFAITFHEKKRSKRTITSSLESVPGIGPAKRKNLLAYFGSIAKIKTASDQEILSVKGISKKDLSSLIAFFKKKR